MIAMVVSIGFVTDMTAMAEDRVSLKGEFKIVGYMSDGFTFDNDDPTKKREWWEQRLRVQPSIKVADGVTVHSRFDFSEHVWGGADYNDRVGAVRPKAGTNSQLQVDRAYVDIDKGPIQVSAGQQYFGLGQNQVLSDNKAGIQVNIKAIDPAIIRIGYIKADENFTNSYTDEDEQDDVDRYFIDLGYASDAFSITAFYLMQSDGTSDKDEPNVAGVYVKTALGAVALKGELATFGGDNAAGTNYVGTQLNVTANFKLSDMVELGAEFVYSDGTDNPTEEKIAYLGVPFARRDIATGETMFYDPFDGFWSNAGVTGTAVGDKGVFDPFDGNTGAIGGAIGAKIMPMDNLTLMGLLYYLTAEKEITGEFENCIVATLAADYMLAANTSLSLNYATVDASFKDVDDPDAADIIALWLKVNF